MNYKSFSYFLFITMATILVFFFAHPVMGEGRIVSLTAQDSPTMSPGDPAAESSEKGQTFNAPAPTGLEKSPGSSAVGSPKESPAQQPSETDSKGNIFSNLQNWQVILLIATPIIVIAIALGIMFITGSMGEKESELVDEEKPKKGRKETPKAKRERRMQLALNLIDHQKIAREGTLKTDYYFRCVDGANKGEIFRITKHVSKIGRRSKDGRINDIEISSLEKKVSREQGLLVFKKEEDTFYLINESDVPIFVNGDRVLGAYPLREGDRVELGGKTVTLVFERETVDIEAK